MTAKVNEKGRMTRIENGRAAFAFEKVARFVKHNREKSKEYKAYVKRLPSIIQVNGLGQALAFYYSKDSTHRQIYQDIAEWIEEDMSTLLQKFKKDNETDEFIEVLVKMSSAEYRFVTMEVLALLNWMRRFVDGMVKEELREV